MHKGGTNNPLEVQLEDKSSEESIFLPWIFV